MHICIDKSPHVNWAKKINIQSFDQSIYLHHKLCETVKLSFEYVRVHNQLIYEWDNLFYSPPLP